MLHIRRLVRHGAFVPSPSPILTRNLKFREHVTEKSMAFTTSKKPTRINDYWTKRDGGAGFCVLGWYAEICCDARPVCSIYMPNTPSLEMNWNGP
jgi:hypothetical protein